MSLLDIFKKRKKITPKKSAAVKEKKIEVGKKEEKVVLKKEPLKKPVRGGEKQSGLAYDIIKKPHISEKATDLGLNNQYIFEVFPNTNKIQIKKAIEKFYGVDVLSVNIIKIPAKKRRIGKTSGFKKGYKKAIVKVKEGQKIEIL